MKIPSALLLIAAVLNSQILNVHSNSCRWLNDGVDCVIQCLEGQGNSYTISGYVQSVYDELSNCHSTGIKLILPTDATGYTLKNNWLTADINLIELEVDAARITTFDGSVFASSIFTKLKKLHLKNIQLLSYEDDIRKSIFDGLVALEELMITNASVKIFDNGWLDNINGTIKSLLVTGLKEDIRILSVEKLTGGSARILSNLEYVKVRYNLTNSINFGSFSAIPNVRELDLSDCSISVIQDFSFEKLGPSLKILNLERNGLTHLPTDIFSTLLLSSSVRLPAQISAESDLIIRLSDNPWHCDCSLTHLKDLLNENTNFAGEILCTTPHKIVNYPIRESVFCPEPETTDTTTESTTVLIENGHGDSIKKECYSHSDDKGDGKIDVLIQPQLQKIRLTGTPDGITVWLENNSSDLILIWFKSEKMFDDDYEYHQNAMVSNCFVDLNNPIRISNLDEDTSYTLCLMNVSHKTASPFDCVSYYNRGIDEQLIAVWLYETSKPLTISLVIVACLISIFIGMLIGILTMKANGYPAFSLRFVFQVWNSPPQEAINPYSRNGHKVNQFSNDIPPPLPPHPFRGLEDNDVYYATVK